MPDESGTRGLPAPLCDASGLRVFVAVARSGSVGRAAGWLGRTQPSVSARLAALETAWNTRLFRRRSRGMSLTPEGLRLLPPAEAALRALEQVDRLAGFPAPAERRLRIGAGDALGRELLPRALSRLVRRHPDVDVYLREGPQAVLLDALRDGEIDLALVVDAVAGTSPTGIAWQPALQSEVHVLAPQGSWRRTASAALPLEWLAERRLVVLPSGSAFRRHLETALAAAGIDFRPAIEVGNLSLVRRFVRAGLGVAPVPAVAFGGGVGRSVMRRRLGGIPDVRYTAAVRAGAPLPQLARQLLDDIAPARTRSDA